MQCKLLPFVRKSYPGALCDLAHSICGLDEGRLRVLVFPVPPITYSGHWLQW
jgi:hypothetical protein